MASSRMRWRISETSLQAPSAMLSRAVPSLALRMAWLVPRTWVRIFSETDRPATSSAARLMRRPVESFCNDAFKPSVFFANELDVIIAVMLWLMRVMRPSVVFAKAALPWPPFPERIKQIGSQFRRALALALYEGDYSVRNSRLAGATEYSAQ